MATTFQVNVSHGKDTYTLDCSLRTTVHDMMQMVENETGVFARLQKLIFKGKVLDPKAQLCDLKMGAGAKVMLLSKAPQAPARGQVQQFIGTTPADIQPPARQRSLLHNRQPDPQAPTTMTLSDRAKTWSKINVISLREMHLADLPPEVLHAPSARVLDACSNQLCRLPPALSQLTALHSIKLSSNKIKCGASPEADTAVLAPLQQLTTLLLDSNALSSMAFVCVGALSRLQVLSLARNQLCEVPAGVQGLPALRVLNLSSNMLSSLPEAIGECNAMVELDASCNQLQGLPAAISRLTSLRCLRLNNNCIKEVPSGMLASCQALVTMNLSNNPISLEALRNTAGYAEYDRRRRDKCDKQLEMAVMLDVEASFSEGADVATWERFSANK